MQPFEITKLSSRGQIVIPKNIRDKLAWTTGDHVMVEVREDMVILRRLVFTNNEEIKHRYKLVSVAK